MSHSRLHTSLFLLPFQPFLSPPSPSPFLGEEEERTLTLPTVEKAAFESVVRFLRLHANAPMQDIPKVS